MGADGGYTTILAYAIAIVGFAMIVAGTWDVYLLYNEQTFEVTLSDYATSIRTIAGGLAMIGLARPSLKHRAAILHLGPMRSAPPANTGRGASHHAVL
jgi:hypothetical protein